MQVDRLREERQWSVGWQCPLCGLKRETEGGPDPCIGYLPGVSFACCGHGKRGYIVFDNGVLIRFNKVIEIERDNRAILKIHRRRN